MPSIIERAQAIVAEPPPGALDGRIDVRRDVCTAEASEQPAALEEFHRLRRHGGENDLCAFG
jgi:hypothetical protein